MVSTLSTLLTTHRLQAIEPQPSCWLAAVCELSGETARGRLARLARLARQLLHGTDFTHVVEMGSA
jgi:hypothetical protein